MCGICGDVDWEGRASEEAVRGMMRRLVHRGPDGEGSWRDPTGVVALGHSRLRVLDLTDRARQPMVGPGGEALVYNGEVYSFQELRDELAAEGVGFRSTGDTEVVLAALARRGHGALERFNGMFALAYWEPERRRLLLARDRIGIKPLFVATLPHGLAFASELPALLAHPGVGRDLDAAAMGRWLQLGYCCGDESLLRGVRRLPPGHLLLADEGAITVRPWYDIVGAVASHPPLEPGEAVEELEPLLRDAVGRRLVSDVPLGCFLSGGVDSALVTAAAVREGARPETLTVRFPQGEDESPAARRLAGSLGLDHLVEPCSADHMLEVFGSWTQIAGDPLADPSLAPTWVVARAARRRWTVALSGDGGDELLSGYPRLRLMPRLEPLLGTPWALRAAAAASPLPPRRWAAKLQAALRSPDRWWAYQALQGVWPASEARRLCGSRETDPPWPAGMLERLDEVPPWVRYRLLDVLTFLPDRVLAKVDRASMRHALEVRVPLLDHRVVERLLSLPPRLGRSKGLLRELLGRWGVPAPARRKRGFEVPLAAWLRGPLRERARSLLFGPEADELGLDAALLRGTFDEHLAGRRDHSERLFAVMVLVDWAAELL